MFDVDEKSKTVTVPVVVPSSSSSLPTRYRYQTSNQRKFFFQVLSIDGHDVLAASTRIISHGDAYKINADNLLAEHLVTIHSGEVTVTDAGYAQTYLPVPLADYYTASAPKEYLDIMNCGVEILVEFDAREVDDGYQYIQFMINDTENCDTGAGDGNPGNINVSYFMAGFGHDPGDKNTNFAKYVFPVTSGYDDCGRRTKCWSSYGNTIGDLYNQYFHDHSSFYQSFEGWFRVSLVDLNTFGIRLNASGNNNDTWIAKNMVARMRVDENYGPKVMYDEIAVSPGPYNKGNKVYVSVPFSEIAKTGSTSPKIQTSWGELSYFSGSGSNVMTFSGTITAAAGTPLTINSKSGSIVDLAGKTMVGELTKDFSNLVVTENYYLDNSWVEVTGISSEPYIDNGINKPGPVSVSYRGTLLTAGVDYTVSYVDNRGPQSGTKTAQAVITGMGHYSGTLTLPYTIRAVELSDFTEVESGVYEIANRDDLMHLSGFVSNGRHDCQGLTFRQTGPIDVGGEFWPIAGPYSTESTFKGTYDGQGKTVSGISVLIEEIDYRDKEMLGLFGHLGAGAVVQGVVIANSTFWGYEDVGTIVGYNQGGQVTDCHVGDDVYIKAYPQQNGPYGGIAGSCDGGLIAGCSSAAVFTPNNRVGGIVGYISGNTTIRDCLYTGAVPAGTAVGQLVGLNSTSFSSPAFTNNYYTVGQTGGINGSDANGARLARTITLDEHLSVVGDNVEYGVAGITAFGDNVMLAGGTLYSGAGQTVTLAITTEMGYRLTTVTVQGGDTPVEVTMGEDNTCSFVMPEGDVTVTATYIQIPRYTFDSATGALTLNWGEFNSNNKWGNDVTPSAVTSVTATGDVSFTGNCYNLFYNFTNCTSMDLGDANTDALTGMFCMFRGCSSLTTLDVSNWNTASAINMTAMFYNCSGLTTLDLSNWNTAKVTGMAGMFYGCSGLTTLDLSNWNSASVTNMDNMFYNCSSLTTIYAGSEWSTASVTSSLQMFKGCTNLVGGMGTSFDNSNTNAEIARFDQGDSGPGYLTGVFTLTLPDDVTTTTTPTLVHGDVNLYAGGTDITLDYNGTPPDGTRFGHFTVDGEPVEGDTFVMPMAPAVVGVEYQARYTFDSATGTLTLNWGEYNSNNKWGNDVTPSAVKSVTATGDVSFTGNCYNLFYNFTNCTSMDMGDANTDALTSMFCMFYNCSSLTTLDLSNWNTASVTKMSSMFRGCSSLTTLDVSNWNTASVTNMSDMFYNCSGLTALDVSEWNTASVSNMSQMFYYCSGLTTLDVSEWNTASVYHMDGMFYKCSGLTTLDVSNWNTASVTDMSSMFYGCSGLTTIYVGSAWNTTSVTRSLQMFNRCTSLVGGNGTTYDPNHVDVEYAHVDGGVDNPGYLTAADAAITLAEALAGGSDGDNVTLRDALAVVQKTEDGVLAYVTDSNDHWARLEGAAVADLVAGSGITGVGGTLANMGTAPTIVLADAPAEADAPDYQIAPVDLQHKVTDLPAPCQVVSVSGFYDGLKVRAYRRAPQGQGLLINADHTSVAMEVGKRYDIVAAIELLEPWDDDEASGAPRRVRPTDDNFLDNIYLMVVSGDENPETGIDDIAADNGKEVEAIYTVDGMRVDRVSTGVYIIQFKDGSVKKVLF